MQIQLTKKIAGLVALLAGAACSAGQPIDQTDGKSGDVQQASGSSNVYCKTTVDCSPGFYCSTEGTTCQNPDGCVGECFVDHRVPCGATLCSDGLVCCNESCGICAPPGKACTQQRCISEPPLPKLEVTTPPSNLKALTSCGYAICGAGETCCDEMCDLCSQDGKCGSCPSKAPPVRCGENFCTNGAICCDTECGACSPTADACKRDVCRL